MYGGEKMMVRRSLFVEDGGTEGEMGLKMVLVVMAPTVILEDGA